VCFSRRKCVPQLLPYCMCSCATLGVRNDKRSIPSVRCTIPEAPGARGTVSSPRLTCTAKLSKAGTCSNRMTALPRKTYGKVAQVPVLAVEIFEDWWITAGGWGLS